MTDPLLVMELATITGMLPGTVAGGLVLLPGPVVQVLPHAGMARLFSKPLNPFGADPPLIGLYRAHCDPQKYTIAPPVMLARLPTTNWPPAGSSVEFTR